MSCGHPAGSHFPGLPLRPSSDGYSVCKGITAPRRRISTMRSSPCRAASAKHCAPSTPSCACATTSPTTPNKPAHRVRTRHLARRLHRRAARPSQPTTPSSRPADAQRRYSPRRLLDDSHGTSMDFGTGRVLCTTTSVPADHRTKPSKISGILAIRVASVVGLVCIHIFGYAIRGRTWPSSAAWHSSSHINSRLSRRRRHGQNLSPEKDWRSSIFPPPNCLRRDPARFALCSRSKPIAPRVLRRRPRADPFNRRRQSGPRCGSCDYLSPLLEKIAESNTTSSAPKSP